MGVSKTMSMSTSKCVQISTPAKLNLFLELLGRRSDGFHELETIMLPINRYDTLRVEQIEKPEVLTRCSWLPSVAIATRRANASQAMMELPRPEDNLVTRALDDFRQAFGIEHGFRVAITKTIPAGAGMGGASSDAASALVAACKLCGIDSRDSRLMQLAAGLGSDVPMFIADPAGSSGAAHATGRGERIKRIACCGRLHFVVIQPPEALSTAAVYKRCSVAAEPVSGQSMIHALATGDSSQVARLLLNRLTAAACEISDWIDRTLAQIAHLPVMGYQMTGSGSACFAICPNDRVAHRIARRLQATGIGLTFAAHTVRLPTPTIQVP